MKYKCNDCRRTYDDKEVKFLLVEKVSNKPRVRVCEKCHTLQMKKAAKESSNSFLPGAKLGL